MSADINISTAEATNLAGSQDLSTFGKNLHSQCRLFMQPVYERHDRAYRFYLGDQWRYMRRRGLSMAVYNIVGPHMDIIASNLTDSQIVFQVSAKNAEDSPMVDIWNEVLRQACEQDSLYVRVYGLLIDVLVKGYGIFKVCHDEKRSIPTSIEIIDPYNYKGEPGVRRPDIDGNYHWHSEWMTAMQVREMYPDKWQLIKYAQAGQTSYDNAYEFLTERSGDLNYTHMALIHELYIRTNETERIPAKVTKDELINEKLSFEEMRPPEVILEQDHKAHQKAHQAHVEQIIGKLQQMLMQAVKQGEVPPEQAEQILQEAITTNPIIRMIAKHNEEHDEYAVDNPRGNREKYNGWRRVVYGGPDWVVLDDGPTPYTDEVGRGIHPFVILTSPATGTDIYEFSVLERCMALQELANLWISKFQDHLGLCATPFLIYNADVITLEPNQLTALAGSVIPCMGDVEKAAKWLQPPQISNQLVQNYFQLQRQIELITGVSDVELGAYPQMERASAPMIGALKEASRARWREYQREFQDGLTRVTKKLMLVIQQYMDEQMQLRIGKVGDAYELLNIPIEDERGNLTRLNDMTRGVFDVRIKLAPLSSLTPEAKLQRAIALFTAANPQGVAIYDLEAVAEESEDPVMIKSVERQKQLQMAQMQAAQQQQQVEIQNKQTKGAG